MRTFWSAQAVENATGHKLEGHAAGGLLHLINSGPAALDWTGEATLENGQNGLKPWWKLTPEDAKKSLEATKWGAAITEYFPGGGWSTDFTTRGDLPVTMYRVNLVKGLGPVLQIAEGFSVELPENVHKILDERTNPSWPTTWFAPILTGEGHFSDTYSVMNAWGANHCVASFGHIGGDLLALAAMLRIPVEMHNVPKERIFRPAAWNRFGGTFDTGADYRACAAYGPLYG